MAAFLLLLLLLASGCASPRPPAVFPIGLYGAPPEKFAELRALGFNTFVAEATPESLAAAQQAGARILAFGGGDPNLRPFSIHRDKLRQFDRHPALLGWYTIDEPDRRQVGSGTVALGNRLVRRTARKPTALAVSTGAGAARYRQVTDLLLVDLYPIPWTTVQQFADEMRTARLGSGPAGFHAVLQAFDWSHYPEQIRTEAPLRPPTEAELRCMAYLALIEGARGLYFYTWQGRTWRLAESPLWPAVSRLVNELESRSTLFSFGVPPSGGPGRKPPKGGTPNAFIQPSSEDSPIRAARIGPYLVAANPSPEPALATFRAPPSNLREVPVLDDSRSVEIVDGQLRDFFDGFAVHIYGPF